MSRSPSTTIDPRKLTRLAETARKAGIAKLTVTADGGCSFELLPEPPGAAPTLAPPPPREPDRFSRKHLHDLIRAGKPDGGLN